MRFDLDAEQRSLAETLDRLLRRADVPKAARAWADGAPGPGLELWRALADVGVLDLAAPARSPGGDPAVQPTVELAVELAVAFEALGRHAVPGPYVEHVCAATALAGGHLDVGSSDAVLTIAVPGGAPYALDADVATRALLLRDRTLHLARPGALVRSVDPARRLFEVTAGEPVGEVAARDREAAVQLATLACSAQLLGLGEAMLASAVGYAKQRRQFGRVVGEYQALKHALADVRVALDFARPLVWGAALALRCGEQPARAVAAAKVASSEAAHRAGRTALQVHGAIGYTAEYDLSLWLLKTRALVNAWGSPREHRGRLLASLLEPGEA